MNCDFVECKEKALKENYVKCGKTTYYYCSEHFSTIKSWLKKYLGSEFNKDYA